MDDRIYHLTAQELLREFKPWERLRRAGYRSTEEFFDKHGWNLTVRQIRQILEREIRLPFILAISDISE
jgi:hypothetical protein